MENVKHNVYAKYKVKARKITLNDELKKIVCLEAMSGRGVTT